MWLVMRRQVSGAAAANLSHAIAFFDVIDEKEAKLQNSGCPTFPERWSGHKEVND